MNRRTWRGSAVGAALFLGAGTTAATEPAVTVEPPSAETCVGADDLRRILARAGIESGPPGSAGSVQPVRVDVEGTPAHLTVVVTSSARTVRESLPATSCDTATDVVAAFLTSALAPAPDVEVRPPPKPALEASRLERAVHDGLARRGIQLVVIGATVRVSRDASGSWFVRVEETSAPACARTLMLGTFDELSPMRVEAVTDQVARPLSDVRACAMRTTVAAPRLDALRTTLDKVDRMAVASSWLGVLEVVSGAVILGALSDSHDPNVRLGFDDWPNAMATSAGAVALAGGATSVFVSEDHRSAVVGASLFASAGALWTSIALYGEPGVPTYSTASLATASYATGLFIGLNGVLNRTPVARLRAARRRLADSLPSDPEVATIERDLARFDQPLSAFVTYAPLIVGGVVASVPAVADGFDSEDRNVFAAFGLTYVIVGSVGVFSADVHAGYRRALAEAGISDVSFGVGPFDRGGLSLSGRF